MMGNEQQEMLAEIDRMLKVQVRVKLTEVSFLLMFRDHVYTKRLKGFQ